MTATTITLWADQTEPVTRFAWPETADTLRDLSEAELRCEILTYIDQNVETVKTLGVVGGNGTGQSNVAIQWTGPELEALEGASWFLRVTADEAGTRSVFELDRNGTLPMLKVLPVPDPAP